MKTAIAIVVAAVGVIAIRQAVRERNRQRHRARMVRALRRCLLLGKA